MGNMVGLFYKNLGKSHGLDHEFNRAFQHHSRVKSRYQGQGSQSAPGSGNAWNQHHEQPGQQAKQEGRQAEQHQAKQRQGRRQEQDQKASNSTSEDEHTRWQAHFEGVIRMPADPYAVLGLDRNATNEQIKWRYRQLAKMTHPDTVQSPVEKAVAEGNFKLVSRAYEQLRASRGIGDASMK
ncbi:Chaperone protein DnaJ [Porphyridium purpureum]|uniref:Chaperone protein DnaJ n=1 Tax=Porphyridium purpureum TaxID=35688 RepID=A0A5J4YVK8_PORPP|nr:Chaperone protein DnaJ [Porphyridium purpureum]|eukprot:POR2294..scf209_3